MTARRALPNQSLRQILKISVLCPAIPDGVENMKCASRSSEPGVPLVRRVIANSSTYAAKARPDRGLCARPVSHVLRRRRSGGRRLRLRPVPAMEGPRTGPGCPCGRAGLDLLGDEGRGAKGLISYVVRSDMAGLSPRS